MTVIHAINLNKGKQLKLELFEKDKICNKFLIQINTVRSPKNQDYSGNSYTPAKGFKHKSDISLASG
jgi:hypothetical protein